MITALVMPIPLYGCLYHYMDAYTTIWMPIPLYGCLYHYVYIYAFTLLMSYPSILLALFWKPGDFPFDSLIISGQPFKPYHIWLVVSNIFYFPE